MSKRVYDQAFKRRFLNDVEVGGYYVKIDMFKVLSKHNKRFNIKTTENDKLVYDEGVIMKRSKSATAFDREQLFTKTELIELFASISINDVWSAQYKTFEKSTQWHKELAVEIKNKTVEEASTYIKNNFKSFGKADRMIIGHKISPNSDNNYYIVRDLSIHFDCLNDGKSIHEAESKSIRNLDVNTLDYLIFNGVKYTLKSK